MSTPAVPARPSPGLAVTVVGGGPGGYAAAIGLARGGARVSLVEERLPGGTCLHRGCIPTKALLETARLCREVAAAADFGLQVPGAGVDWPAVRARQDRAVAALTQGLTGLLRAAGVTLLRGRAHLLPPERPGAPPAVRVTGPDAAVLHPEALVLAPGSAPARPRVPGMDLPGVVDSDGLLAAVDRPGRLLVVGGGAIGCEFATAHAALGAEVAVVEALPQLLPAADPEIARRLQAAFRRRGIAVHPGARLLRIEPGLTAQLETASGPLTLSAETVLVATGRRPATGAMGLVEAGVPLAPSGAIVVGEGMRCPGVDGVWALGDALGGPGYAHGAFAQAAVVVAAVLGRPLPALPPLPHVVYAHPEVAWVGASQGAAVARVPFAALGRAHAAGDVDGLCKVVVDEGGRVVGVHLIGAHATELVAAGCVAVARGLRIEELAGVVLPHPTWGEALGEAAHLLLGVPLHLPLPPGGAPQR